MQASLCVPAAREVFTPWGTGRWLWLPRFVLEREKAHDWEGTRRGNLLVYGAASASTSESATRPE